VKRQPALGQQQLLTEHNETQKSPTMSCGDDFTCSISSEQRLNKPKKNKKQKTKNFKNFSSFFTADQSK
jgi:hypothetical protein